MTAGLSHEIRNPLNAAALQLSVLERRVRKLPEAQQSPLLEPVRQAFFADRPIPWRRVHDLPDFVYFNHSIHVSKGVGCFTCHGRVDQMAAIEQHSTLTMSWCIDCHRNPNPHLRPQEYITSMTWAPPADAQQAKALADTLAKENNVHSRTNCSTCHR